MNDASRTLLAFIAAAVVLVVIAAAVRLVQNIMHVLDGLGNGDTWWLE